MHLWVMMDCQLESITCEDGRMCEQLNASLRTAKKRMNNKHNCGGLQVVNVELVTCETSYTNHPR